MLHYCSVLALYLAMYVCKYIYGYEMASMCIRVYGELKTNLTSHNSCSSVAVILLQVTPIRVQCHPSAMPLQPVGTHVRACLN